MRPQVCISNIKTPKSVVQILRPQARRTNTETSSQHFNYWDLRSAIQISSSYWCGGSVPTENIWIISEKWKWNFGNLHMPQLAAGSESERKYLLPWRWKVQKSAMKMWAVSTLKMDNMDILANIMRLLSGRSGGRWTWSSPFLACRWPPLESTFSQSLYSPSPVSGDHHGNLDAVGQQMACLGLAKRHPTSIWSF